MAITDNEKSRSSSSDSPPISRHEHADGASVTNPRKASLAGQKSPGVARIEEISRHFTDTDRIIVFLSVFLLAFAYNLDSAIRYTYQATATASYGTHSLLATVNVIRGVVAAAAQPTAAKIADVFGRIELILVAIVFYVLGTIIEAASSSVQTFAGGAVLYQIGYTCILLLVEVVIADITSLRSRLFFSYIPPSSFLIIAWVSGDVTSAVLAGTTWQWGIGMWAIIFPICAIPLISILYIVGRRAKKAGDLDSFKSPFQRLGPRKLAVELFWQLDVVGIILLVAFLGLILAPLTLAGGANGAPVTPGILASNWRRAKIIVPVVIGLLCVPFFIVWEMRTRNPLVPFHLLKDRAVWAALGLAVMLNFVWTMQGDYLYTVLIVAFNQSIKSATRITTLYSFTSVLTGMVLGVIVFKVRRLKGFIVAGTILFLVAFGLLIRYRGSPSGAQYSGVIGAQILLGIAGGMFPYPAQASIQAATQHEHVAVVTGLYLSCYSIGSALGNTVSGAIWTQVLPNQLELGLSQFGNATLASSIYGNPFAFVAVQPVGTDQRGEVIDAYQYTQRLLCITGICLCVVLIMFASLLRDPKLGKEQSLPNAEGGLGAGTSPEVVEEKKNKKWWDRLR